MKKRSITAAVIAASLLFVACGDDKNDAAAETTAAPAETAAPTETMAPSTDPMTTEPMTSETMAEDPGTIVDIAAGNPDFSTLVAAVTAAGLVETLSGEGPFTVFAPTNEAFAALPAGLVDKLLLPENKDVLTQILTYHVVSGKVMSTDVAAGDVPSVEGSPIAVTVDGGTVKLNGSATVTAVDIEASNGVIHVIDAVILPPGLDVSAL
jgi:uncharacterized surface protein with fasciclin (FAS1) repeats